jgi:hypothetical protein
MKLATLMPSFVELDATWAVTGMQQRVLAVTAFSTTLSTASLVPEGDTLMQYTRWAVAAFSPLITTELTLFRSAVARKFWSTTLPVEAGTNTEPDSWSNGYAAQYAVPGPLSCTAAVSEVLVACVVILTIVGAGSKSL